MGNNGIQLQHSRVKPNRCWKCGARPRLSRARLKLSRNGTQRQPARVKLSKLWSYGIELQLSSVKLRSHSNPFLQKHSRAKLNRGWQNVSTALHVRSWLSKLWRVGTKPSHFKLYCKGRWRNLIGP